MEIVDGGIRNAKSAQSRTISEFQQFSNAIAISKKWSEIKLILSMRPVNQRTLRINIEHFKAPEYISKIDSNVLQIMIIVNFKGIKN